MAYSDSLIITQGEDMNPSQEQQTAWYLANNSEDNRDRWNVEITRTPFVIGRTEDNNLVLRSKAISRHHAEINLSGNLLWIRDLKSTNGTYVNCSRIDDAVELRDHDTINLGGAELIVCQDNRAKSDDLYEETYAIDMAKEFEAYKAMLELEPKLRQVIENRLVVPHYQPIVRMSDSDVVAYEILGRLNASCELPEKLEDLFELTSMFGLTPQLSDLFRKAGVTAWENLGDSIELFMNTHPEEMEQIDDLADSLKILRKSAPNAAMVIEINERSIQSIGTLNYLRGLLEELNMKLAYDDFGVGETRLVELAKVPPDYLKFDISIIRNIHLAPKRLHQMVKTFIDATCDLGIKPLAEGVENREEASKCRDLGFQYGQGFYFGRPASVSNL
jgi:EAL domain-containing protein (putative c-di-GMP-specific phosphodiesterase class I)